MHITGYLFSNGTSVNKNSDFYLLGFQGSPYHRGVLFCLLLLVYTATICGNLLIIALVSTSKNLHTPMYFFISQLSISDILLTADIVPNLFHILLNNGGTITFLGCMSQWYFFSASEVFECLLLTVMSHDRYVAICNPLRYPSIITRAYCLSITILCWLFSFSISLSDTISTAKLSFCGSNIIDHFFCDLVPLLEIACSDTFLVTCIVNLTAVPVVIIPCIVIIISYINIFITILKIPTRSGRSKTFSTCGSHLTVVCIFYWTLVGVYVFPMKGQTLKISKIMSLLYTVFTPMVNPMIYSLRNKDILKTLKIYV